MGGNYHEILVQLASASALGGLVLFAAVSWIGAARTLDGSVLAGRLGSALPGFVPVLLAAAGWFAVAERLEPQHAASPAAWAVVAALAVAAWLTLRVARAVVAVVAGAVARFSAAPFAPRSPVWAPFALPAPRPQLRPLLRRRFARPPPVRSSARA